MALSLTDDLLKLFFASIDLLSGIDLAKKKT
jgi:hypothetical protein